MSKQQKELGFVEYMEKVESIDQLQREAITAYDEGMTYMALARFQNINSLSSNSFTITPASVKVNEDLTLVETGRRAFSLVPQFSSVPQWSELSQEEYDHETKVLLSEPLGEHPFATAHPAIHKVREEFTKSLQKYLQIALLMREQS